MLQTLKLLGSVPKHKISKNIKFQKVTTLSSEIKESTNNHTAHLSCQMANILNYLKMSS